MGSSKKTTVGYRYWIGAHMVLCRGPVDRIYEIQVAKRIARVGSFTDGIVNINQPELFGGESREGGIVGDVDLEFGATDQIVNDYLEGQQGAGVTPAYRGILAAVLRQVEIGMNPYLKPWAFRTQRIFVRGREGNAQWYPSKAAISMYEDLTEFETQTLNPRIHGGSTHEEGATNGLVFDGYDSSDTIYVTLTHDQLYGGWSPWGDPTPANCDAPNVNDRSGVLNRVWVAPNGDHTQSFMIGDNDCHDGYEAARIAFPNAKLTGASSYTIYIIDTSLSDNTGSMAFSLGPSVPGEDMNPAHIIREAITDTDWGLGFDESEIGSTFTTVADTLFTEKFGLSGKWEKQAEVEEFIKEILAHIDGYVYVDNATGLWEIKLIRDDYDVENIPVVDETHVVSLGNDIERIDPVEAVNSVTVRYTDNLTGDSVSITSQDQALVAESGAIRSTSLDFEFIRWEGLAGRVAMRELLALSSPLLTGTITVNRKAPELKPGDPFILNLPRYHINNEVVRASNIVYDEKNSEVVNITIASDVFAMADASLVNSVGAETVSHINSPQSITRRLVEEAPYWSLVQQLGDSDAESRTTTRPELGFLHAAGESPTDDAIHAQVSVNPDGNGFVESGIMDFSPTATLNGALTADASVTSMEISNSSDISDVVIGTLATISGTEMVRIDAISGTTVTIGRGCLDTVPQAHANGAAVLFWGGDPEAADETEYADSESIDVKLLTVTGLGTLAEGSAPTDTVVFDSRASRPFPVGKFQLDGEYVPSADLDDTDEVLTWVHRDRLTQTSTVIDDFTAGSIGPEANVDYTVLITWRDVNGDQVGSDLVNTSVGTALTYTLTGGYLASKPVGAVELWFQVQTLRDGLREWTTPTIKGTLP